MIYAQYLMDRYLGKKGQGLTEYAIILLLVVLIGVAIYTGTGVANIKAQITNLYSIIGTDLSTISTKSGS